MPPFASKLSRKVINMAELRRLASQEIRSVSHSLNCTEDVAEIPSEIIVDILSRIPLKSLARFRCVSKLWQQCIDNDSHLHKLHGERHAEEPTPVIMFQQKTAREDHKLRVLSLCNSKEDLNTASKVKKHGLSTFKLPPYPNFLVPRVQGFCYGWFCLSLNYGVCYAVTWVVVHPLRKECYNVPLVRYIGDDVPPIMDRRDNIVPLVMYGLDKHICGLGFDNITKTYKIVCIVVNSKKQKVTAMVHILGTESWRTIPQEVPSYPTSEESVFADGFLYWLVGEGDPTKDEGRTLMRFDASQ